MPPCEDYCPNIRDGAPPSFLSGTTEGGTLDLDGPDRLVVIADDDDDNEYGTSYPAIVVVIAPLPLSPSRIVAQQPLPQPPTAVFPQSQPQPSPNNGTGSPA